MSYVLNVSRQHARLVDQHGRSCAVVFFLHPTEHGGSRRGTVASLLNKSDMRFLPVEIEGEVELIQVSWIQYVELDSVAPEVAQLEEVGAFRERAELFLASGEILNGDLLYESRPQNARVSDLLNSVDSPFLLLCSDDKTYLVQRRAIVRVKS